MHPPEDHAPTSPPAVTPGAATAGAGRDAEDTGGTFRLHVRFSGLCLFVPEPAGGINPQGELAAMHVLLMNAGDDTPTHGWSRPVPCPDHATTRGTHRDRHAAGARAHPKHYCMLYVDEGHLDGRHLDEHSCPTSRWVGLPLKDTTLTLPGGGVNLPPPKPLSAAVIPIHEVTDVEGLDRKWIEKKPDRQIAAQVVLTAGERTERPGDVRVEIVEADAPPEPKSTGEPWPWPVAGEVDWVIPDVRGGKLTVRLHDIDTHGREVLKCDLYPVKRELRLYVCCLPLYELPGAPPGRRPKRGDPIEHFEQFFSVLPGVTPLKLILAEDSERTSSTSVCASAQVRLARR